MNRLRPWLAYWLVYRWLGAVPMEWSRRDNDDKYRYLTALLDADRALRTGQLPRARMIVTQALQPVLPS